MRAVPPDFSRFRAHVPPDQARNFFFDKPKTAKHDRASLFLFALNR